MTTEWKKGYEEGFAAGWRAAKVDVSFTTTITAVPTGNYSVTTAKDPYSITLNEEKVPKKATLKIVRNVTDHTNIV